MQITHLFTYVSGLVVKHDALVLGDAARALTRADGKRTSLSDAGGADTRVGRLHVLGFHSVLVQLGHTTYKASQNGKDSRTYDGL